MKRLPNLSCMLAVLAPLVAVGCGNSTGGAPSKPDAATMTVSPTRPKADASRDAQMHHDTGTSSQHDAGAPAVDAPPDVDNGAPSTMYPAPHPPLPQLTNLQGGPVLTTPHVYLVVYPGYSHVSDLQTFATNMTTATYWSTVTSQYGVGPLTYSGTITLTGEAPAATLTSGDIETWVSTELASGAFGTPDPEGIYTVFYPSTTTITQPNPIASGLAPSVSCVAFGGYHDNVAVALTDGGTPTEFSYAVIPTCSTSVQDLTAVVSHEWVESSTDPFLTSNGMFGLTGGPDSAFFTTDADHAVWALLGGGEAGDLCEPEGNSAYVTPSDVGYLVQRTWSNSLALGSHDPCAPSPPSTAYFNSAPVLPETVTVMSSFTGTIVTKGITIPAAQSATIEVDLFSDGDTGGAWTVSAEDTLYAYYGSYGLKNTLAFEWDRTTGVNGDKLHLTITVTNESILDGLHAFTITSTLGSRQTVWPGLILE